MQIAPAPNVAYASVAGLITTIIAHILAAHGIPVTPDEEGGLTLLIAMAVAHGMDMWNSKNDTK